VQGKEKTMGARTEEEKTYEGKKGTETRYFIGEISETTTKRYITEGGKAQYRECPTGRRKDPHGPVAGGKKNHRGGERCPATKKKNSGHTNRCEGAKGVRLTSGDKGFVGRGETNQKGKLQKTSSSFEKKMR